MDRGKRLQQRTAHQRTGSATRFLHTAAPAVAVPQHELRRRLCHGARLLPPLQDWQDFLRTVSLPPLGGQQRCHSEHREGECQQLIQGQNQDNRTLCQTADREGNDGLQRRQFAPPLLQQTDGTVGPGKGELPTFTMWSNASSTAKATTSSCSSIPHASSPQEPR